jgi:hypothetical protein
MLKGGNAKKSRRLGGAAARLMARIFHMDGATYRKSDQNLVL